MLFNKRDKIKFLSTLFSQKDSNILSYLKGRAPKHSEKDIFYSRENKVFALMQCKQGIEMTLFLSVSCLCAPNLMKIVRKFLLLQGFYSVVC
jgi:hypothetical protein